MLIGLVWFRGFRAWGLGFRASGGFRVLGETEARTAQPPFETGWRWGLKAEQRMKRVEGLGFGV